MKFADLGHAVGRSIRLLQERHHPVGDESNHVPSPQQASSAPAPWAG
jgi:hypothetical protein